MIVPVGAVAPLAGFTVAVRVTAEFCVIDEVEAVRVVLVAMVEAVTLTATGLDVDALKVLFPAYEAVMELTPIDSAVVESVAVPEESVAVPIDVVPL